MKYLTTAATVFVIYIVTISTKCLIPVVHIVIVRHDHMTAMTTNIITSQHAVAIASFIVMKANNQTFSATLASVLCKNMIVLDWRCMILMHVVVTVI
jgi:hypothetical protein